MAPANTPAASSSKLLDHSTQPENAESTVGRAILLQINIKVLCVLEPHLHELIWWCLSTDNKRDTFVIGTVKAQLEKTGAGSLSLVVWLHTHVHNLYDEKHQIVQDNAQQKPIEPAHSFDFFFDTCSCIQHLTNRPLIQSIRDFFLYTLATAG